MRKLSSLFLITFALMMSVCVNSVQAASMSSEANQKKINKIQSRYYTIDSEERAVSGVIATLEDMGYMIDKSSFVLGTVSATNATTRQLKMKVIISTHNDTQKMIRANARYNNNPMFDDAFYKDFFIALSRKLSLRAYPVR